MKKDPWLPFTLGVILQAIAIPISLFLPETLGAKKPGEPAKSKEAPTDTPPSYTEKEGAFQSKSSKLMKLVNENTGFLLKDWRIIFLASTYVSLHL